MADNDVLLDVLEKFTSSYINLTDKEALDPEFTTYIEQVIIRNRICQERIPFLIL